MSKKLGVKRTPVNALEDLSDVVIVERDFTPLSREQIELVILDELKKHQQFVLQVGEGEYRLKSKKKDVCVGIIEVSLNSIFNMSAVKGEDYIRSCTLEGIRAASKEPAMRDE